MLTIFALGLVLAFTKAAPAGAETILNVMLGALGSMSVQVVSYWVGSSSGSARKTEIMNTTAEGANGQR